MNRQRIGIYGGSFDPVHLGHLLVAETVRDQIGLDQVRWIPAFQSPLKLDRPPTPPKARLEMLSLAIGGHSPFVIDDRELRRAGVSYTIDTVRELQAELTDAEWFLILGADSLVEFHKWKEPKALCELVTPIVVARGGEKPVDWDYLKPFTDEERLARFREVSIMMPVIEISSRDLRDRLQRKRSIRYQVPAAVEAYIRTSGLYASLD